MKIHHQQQERDASGKWRRASKNKIIKRKQQERGPSGKWRKANESKTNNNKGGGEDPANESNTNNHKEGGGEDPLLPCPKITKEEDDDDNVLECGDLSWAISMAMWGDVKHVKCVEAHLGGGIDENGDYEEYDERGEINKALWAERARRFWCNWYLYYCDKSVRIACPRKGKFGTVHLGIVEQGGTASRFYVHHKSRSGKARAECCMRRTCLTSVSAPSLDADAILNWPPVLPEITGATE